MSKNIPLVVAGGQIPAGEAGAGGWVGGVVFSSDRVHKELAVVDATHRGRDEIDAGLYSSEMSRRTCAELRRLTTSTLEQCKSVILDATYRTRSDRAEVIEVARKLGLPCWIVECQLSESAALARIAARQSRGEGASDADAEVYRVQRSCYEPIDPAEASYARADTSKPIAAVVNQVMRQIHANT